eukprot:198963-Chlamydomonas_euryale.AAC.2
MLNTVCHTSPIPDVPNSSIAVSARVATSATAASAGCCHRPVRSAPPAVRRGPRPSVASSAVGKHARGVLSAFGAALCAAPPRRGPRPSAADSATGKHAAALGVRCEHRGGCGALQRRRGCAAACCRWQLASASADGELMHACSTHSSSGTSLSPAARTPGPASARTDRVPRALLVACVPARVDGRAFQTERAYLAERGRDSLVAWLRPCASLLGGEVTAACVVSTRPARPHTWQRALRARAARRRAPRERADATKWAAARRRRRRWGRAASCRRRGRCDMRATD